MPNCFRLIDKVTGIAAELIAVDERICKEVLNVAVNPELWGGGYGGNAFNWYDTIGFQIADGKILGSAELREHYSKSTMWVDEWPVIAAIIDYLELHYSSDNWYQVGK